MDYYCGKVMVVRQDGSLVHQFEQQSKNLFALEDDVEWEKLQVPKGWKPESISEEIQPRASVYLPTSSQDHLVINETVQKSDLVSILKN